MERRLCNGRVGRLLGRGTTRNAITAGRTYLIRNRGSGHVLTAGDDSTEPSATLDTRPPRQDKHRVDQLWHVFPLDQGSVLLVNKGSGLLVSVAGNSTAPSARLEQHGLQRVREATQTWMLRAAPGGGHHLINKRSGLYMNLAGAVPDQYYLQTGPAATQVWDLVVEDEYQQVTGKAPGRDPADIGDVNRMTEARKLPPGQTTPVLVGQVALPFVMVADPDLTPRQQSLRSPYYLLSRHGYWQRVYHYSHGGAADHTETEIVTVGLTTGNAEEVRSRVGISVTADAAVGYGPVTATLSATVSAELAVPTTATQATTRSATVSRTYARGTRITEAVWYREDRFVLARLDGTPITEWTVRDRDSCIADAYPLSPQQALVTTDRGGENLCPTRRA